MKSLVILILAVAATTLFADTFTIERNDPRPFRIWNEKPPRPEVCLNLDIRQLGLGEGSCGPRTEPQYIFPIQPESWTVTLSPQKQIKHRNVK